MMLTALAPDSEIAGPPAALPCIMGKTPDVLVDVAPVDGLRSWRTSPEISEHPPAGPRFGSESNAPPGAAISKFCGSHRT